MSQATKLGSLVRKLFHLLIDGIYWGEITPDPNLLQTSWDIQVSGGPKYIVLGNLFANPTQKNKKSPQPKKNRTKLR